MRARCPVLVVVAETEDRDEDRPGDLGIARERRRREDRAGERGREGREPAEMMEEVRHWIEAEMRRLDPEAYSPPPTGFAGPLEGGTASGPAKPDPRQLLGQPQSRH